MVFVNDKKFACEACIKGHRSSSCSHADRPLYEIKKKGRPVSQCSKCRELRSTKRVHSKCTCSDAETRARETKKSFGTKQKRYIPVIPTLPNGLSDMFANRRDMENENLANPRQRVDALLNPCLCPDVWSCTCAAASSGSPANSTAEAGPSGLATLARVAEYFENQNNNTHSSPTLKARKRRPSPTPLPPRAKPAPAPARGPELPPIALPPPVASPTLPAAAAREMPSFSTFRSLAGSGCTCGLQCSCPGCTEHATESEEKCGDDCSHCVDHSVREVDLSSAGFGFSTGTLAHKPEESSSVARSSVLDHFFKHAARVPPPPVPGGKPVALPKLCCGGSCGCGVACGCGSGCVGCCSDSEQDKETVPVPVPRPTPAKKSCCSG